MKLKAIHPTFQEALGIYEAFRKLGFSSDEVFWYLNPDPQYVHSPGTDGSGSLDTFDKPGRREMLVVLKTQGKEFRVTVGIVNMSYKTWEAAWKSLCTAVMERHVNERDLDIIWQNCLAFKDKLSFIMAIGAKGIVIPLSAGQVPDSGGTGQDGWN